MEQNFPFNAILSVQILRRIWLQDTEEITGPASSSSSSSSSPDNFHIKFHIMYKHYWKSPWETGIGSLHLVRVDPPSFKDFTIDPCLLNQTHDSYPLLYRILIELNIEPDGHDSLVRKIYSFAHNMAKSVIKNTNTMGCKKLVMCVEISFATVYYCERRMEINRAMRESTEEYARRGNGMVPALGSSIEALEKVKLDERDIGENCMVCLEEFSMESLVTRMPCSHVFHGSCIVMWLEKSNACPLCRFMLS